MSTKCCRKWKYHEEILFEELISMNFAKIKEIYEHLHLSIFSGYWAGLIKINLAKRWVIKHVGH